MPQSAFTPIEINLNKLNRYMPVHLKHDLCPINGSAKRTWSDVQEKKSRTLFDTFLRDKKSKLFAVANCDGRGFNYHVYGYVIASA